MTGARTFEEARRQALVVVILILLGALVLFALLHRESADSARVAAHHLFGRMRSRSVGFGWSNIPALAAMGLAAGFLTGLLGMGGGVLKVSGILLVLKLDIAFAQAVSVVTLFASSVSALHEYRKTDRIMWRIARGMLPMSVVGVIAGVLLASSLSGPTLTHLFGFGVLFLALVVLALLIMDPTEQVVQQGFLDLPPERHRRVSGFIGACHGFICGVMGISGGVISSPLQQLLARLPVRNAVANTVLSSAVVTGIASLLVVPIGLSRGDFTLDQFSLVTLCVGGGAAVGGQIGARLEIRMSTVWLRLLFVLLATAAALSILF